MRKHRKHSPGPWRIGETSNMTAAVIAMVDGVSEPIAFPIYMRGKRGEEESMANARLIAEAPAMFDTMKRVMAEWDLNGDFKFKWLEDAIAKVEEDSDEG